MELGKYWIFQALGAIVSEVEASPKSQEGRRCHKALPRYVRMKTELIYCRQCVSALYLGKTEVPNAKGETFSDCDLHEKKTESTQRGCLLGTRDDSKDLPRYTLNKDIDHDYSTWCH